VTGFSPFDFLHNLLFHNGQAWARVQLSRKTPPARQIPTSHQQGNTEALAKQEVFALQPLE